MIITTTIPHIGGIIVSSENQIAVPSMVGFEVLNKIILGYLKVGADKEPTTTTEISSVTNVARNNISLNSKFLKSIGVIEGKRKYKLTQLGTKYAQALDWGKLNEANRFLKELLADKQITKRSLAYVALSKAVDKENLVSQIAMIAGVRKALRFETGIRGFIDMLVTSGFLGEDKKGELVILESSKNEQTYKEATDSRKKFADEAQLVIPIKSKKRAVLPITLNINISDDTNENNLRKILKVIKEALLEE